MKYFKSILTLSLVASLAFLNAACTSETQSKANTEKDSTAAIPVEIASATRGTISAYYSTTATLEAEGEAMVVAKVRGILKDLKVEEGDFVKEGQVMAQLDDEQLQIEAQRAKATMDRMYNDYQRNKELFNKELVSADQFENSKFEYESQKSAYELAKLNVEYSKIKAPISGVVSERMVKKGNMISTDQQLFKITDFDPLLAILHVPEHEMNKLKKGQNALIQADAVQGEQFSGKVLRISPVVNPETGTFKVTVAVSDDTSRLKPGMFARVRIVYDTRNNALMIPKEAVMNEDGSSSVYVIDDKLVFRRSIQTGYVNGSNIEVTNGLKDGDEVVTIGQSSLQDSALVQVVSY
ncbi:MAG: efflux RND transporter periplasmic adaptor subunit [Balneolaceae bacterium]|nr:efflux RND transporter periplasmic adaptor subunit [Balneolaceae bacterium]